MREELQRRGVFVVPLPIYASANDAEDAAVEIPAPGPEVGAAVCGGLGCGGLGCRLGIVGCRSPRLGHREVRWGVQVWGAGCVLQGGRSLCLG